MTSARQNAADQTPASSRISTRPSSRSIWLPLIIVIAVLAILAAAPTIVSPRERRLRAFISDVVDPARLRAADIAASLADEMFAVAMSSARPRVQYSPAYREAAASERQSVLALDSLLPRIGPEAVEAFAQYRESATRWHDDIASIGARPPTEAELDTAGAHAMSTSQAVRRLATTLDDDVAQTRARVRSLEQITLVLPIALVPLALLACVLVIRSGRQLAAVMHRSRMDRDALARTMEEKSLLMRGITHDLQNPLGAARGHVDLVLDGVVPPDEIKDVLYRVRRLLTATIDSVAGLLAVARSETGELHISPISVNLVELARAAIDDQEPLASSKAQTISLHVQQECRAVADPGHVRQIVDNLLSNAIKYAPSGGAIRVFVTRGERDRRILCAIVIENSGPDVPVEWRERIFEEFVRAPAAAATRGTGIGLTVSRRIARMMGGDVTLDDAAAHVALNGLEPLGGAIFTVWLVPAGDAIVPEREAHSAPGGV